jgi:Fe2+ transport system protein FeoA
LHFLAPGQTALVEELHGPVEQVHRLEELGIRAGVEIEMVQPGSPCIVRVSGGKLCFRQCERVNVLVRPVVEPQRVPA